MPGDHAADWNAAPLDPREQQELAMPKGYDRGMVGLAVRCEVGGLGHDPARAVHEIDVPGDELARRSRKPGFLDR
jgi:hypothetical protein